MKRTKTKIKTPTFTLREQKLIYCWKINLDLTIWLNQIEYTKMSLLLFLVQFTNLQIQNGQNGLYKMDSIKSPQLN